MKRALALAAALGAAAAPPALTGCSPGVDGVPVDGLRPDFAVLVPPVGPSRVVAVLRDGEARFELLKWDRLSASAGGLAQVLELAPEADGPSYQGSFPSLGEGELATVSFSRTGEAQAVDSLVTVPAPVAMTAPAAGVTVQAGGTLQVAWVPSGTADRVVVRMASTRCSGGGQGGAAAFEVAGDAGTATVPVPAELLPAGLPAGGSCTADVRVERVRAGTVSPLFEPGGRIEARQSSNAVAIAVTR